MTKLVDQQQTATGASPPRGVHIVDAVKGPLVGEGRFRRTLPFAMTAAVGLAIGVPTTSWTRPGLAIAGSIVFAATIVVAFALPWHRLPRRAQLAAPYLIIIGTMMLANASGSGIGSAFSSMAVLPLMWLALSACR